MKNAVVYVLYSEKDCRTYVGSTSDTERRIKEHNNGKCYSTKNRRPLKLIYKENYNTLSEARKREKYLKSHSGRKILKQVITDIIGE
jgi:putative endonuclease